jgi:hypothetical protein
MGSETLYWDAGSGFRHVTNGWSCSDVYFGVSAREPPLLSERRGWLTIPPLR